MREVRELLVTGGAGLRISARWSTYDRTMDFIVVSGKTVDRTDLAAALGTALLDGLSFDVRVSSQQIGIPELTARALALGARRVVAVGGDGTLHEGLIGLGALRRREGPVVAVIPCGTANDFAGQFGIPVENLTQWLALALAGPTRVVDVGTMDGVPFVNMATIGVPAEISGETDPTLKDALGKLAYTVSALASLGSVRPVALEVRAPSVSFVGDALAVCVANGRQAGGGFVLAPDAELDDGLLDLVIVPAMGLVGAGAVASGAWLGGINFDGRVIRAKVPWVELRVSDGADPVAVSLDGEVERRSKARFEVVPGALQMALP